MWLFFLAAKFLFEAPEPTPGISANLIRKLSQRLQLTFANALLSPHRSMCAQRCAIR